jgi:hypothetical protein
LGEEHKHIIETILSRTTFEITTAMAYSVLRRKKVIMWQSVRWSGWSLDATNLIRHGGIRDYLHLIRPCEILGDTLAKNSR